ncbi:MAG: ATP-binding protein [Bacteroidaceae bacterium]|nr:ATP-binding protein [Bacteroidaceae bacterium]
MTRIVLTGGPCAGKTSALELIVDHFTNKGYKVFTIPEMPTLFTQSGMNYLTKNKDFFYEGEKATLEMQLAFEDRFTLMAKTLDMPCLIICDRGTMDISAYMTAEMWSHLMELAGTSSEELRRRYDAVLHMTTTACGSEEFYTTSTNAQRYEQANEEGMRIARELDRKVYEAWIGHPYLKVIDNQEYFAQKAQKVVEEIEALLATR